MNNKGIEFYIAKELFDTLYEEVKSAQQSSFYSYLIQKGIFENSDIALFLYSIHDNSYDYIIPHLQGEEKKTLINLFSGSGRLYSIMQNLTPRCSISQVISVDSAENMIAFQKKMTKGKNIVYLCRDVLLISDDTSKGDLILCHCGIRYLPIDDYEQLISIMTGLKKNDKSLCYVTETNESLFCDFCKVLHKSEMNYDCEIKRVKIHRNSRLYYAFIAYNENRIFKDLVDRISDKLGISYRSVLFDLSGYKEANQYIVTF